MAGDEGFHHLPSAIRLRPRLRDPLVLAAFEQVERRNRLDAGMAKLSARDRATIRLRDLEGLSIEETASVLARSQEAVKSTHFRARRRLASALTHASA